jgi:DNA-binding transcriptional LysR family regulator
VDLFQMETFLAVAREGSFSKAAKKLYRTQPAISQTIRKLEEEIGEALFDRSSREGLLTDAGRVLEEYAQRLLNMRTEALAAVGELRQLERGHLSIGANEVTCLYLLPMLDKFRDRCPMVSIAVQRSLASHIPEELMNRSIELGLITYKVDQPELRSVVIYRDELVFVMPPTHPLAGAGQLSITQLGAEVFVAHNVPSPYRAKVIDTFKHKNVPLHMHVELPTVEAIKKFVARERGLALLPGISVEDEIARGELASARVKELAFERKVRIVYRRNSALSHAARAFLDVAESFSKQKGGRYMFQPDR